MAPKTTANKKADGVKGASKKMPPKTRAQRFCDICGTSCGTTFKVPDLDFLQEHHLASIVPTAQAFACRECRCLSGLSSRLDKFALCAAGGQLSSLKRLHPDNAALQGVKAAVRSYIEGKEFKATRHGASDYKLDRMSLYITGVMADYYHDNKHDMYFTLFFLRLACNDSDAAQRFLHLWHQATGVQFGMGREFLWSSRLISQLPAPRELGLTANSEVGLHTCAQL